MDNQRKQLEYEASEVFDYGTRQRARERLAALNTNTNQNPTVWHDCCKGYDHAPWCARYVEPEGNQHARREAIRLSQAVARAESANPTTSTHQPAARGGGDEWRYREGSGVIYDAATVPTKIIARYVDANVAQQIIIAHDLYQPMLDALKEVEAMLNKELARDYESQSWAKKVRAALMTIEQRSTSE